MNKSPWIVSGLALVFVWPVAGMMTAFAYDAPTVPTYFAVVRGILGLTLLAIPVVWLGALVLSILEARGKNREWRLKRFAMAPYLAAGVHVAAWIAAIAGTD